MGEGDYLLFGNRIEETVRKALRRSRAEIDVVSGEPFIAMFRDKIVVV